MARPSKVATFLPAFYFTRFLVSVYTFLTQIVCVASTLCVRCAHQTNNTFSFSVLVRSACTSCPKKEMAPKSRSRSSSANEASKPINFGRKWPSSGGNSSCTNEIRYFCSKMVLGVLGSAEFCDTR